MCGRFTLRTPAPKLMELFRVPNMPLLFPRYNIAPTQRVLCIRQAPESDVQMEAIFARWGLIPFWAKDESIGNRMINARSETVFEKPAFRQAYRWLLRMGNPRAAEEATVADSVVQRRAVCDGGPVGMLAS